MLTHDAQNIAKIAKTNDPQTLVLCSAISEVFLRRLAKQGFVKYTEGSEFVDSREDLIDNGDPEGGGLKEMDEKLKKCVLPSTAAAVLYNLTYITAALITSAISFSTASAAPASIRS